MNPHHMVTPVQQQDTYSYTTRTELSSTVSECTEDTQSIEEPSIRVSHPTTSATTSVGTTQSSGATAASPVVPDVLLDAAPKMIQVVKFLKPFESQWQLIGVSLELEMNKVRLIDYSNNSSCLASVLEAWKRTGSSPYTWRSVIEVVEALGDNDNVKEEIETFLLRQYNK